MDKLIIIPLLIVALYFMYRYIRKSIKGEGCHGDCSNCPLASEHLAQKPKDCIQNSQSNSR